MCVSFLAVTAEGKVYACGEATNGRLGLGLSSGTIPIPRQVSALSNYVVKKVAVHSGLCLFFPISYSHCTLSKSFCLKCFFFFFFIVCRWAPCYGSDSGWESVFLG